jgi:hypothetical protein
MAIKLDTLTSTLAAAHNAAEKQTNKYIREYGEHPLNCGFAWVKVQGVRGKALNVLKEFGFKKTYVGSGHSLWNPSQNNTQDMSAKMAGAEVYAEMLREIGINADAQCRLD